MGWIEQQELQAKKQVISDIEKFKKGAKTLSFNGDYGMEKALIVTTKNDIPNVFAVVPVAHNKMEEYDVFKVKTPKEADYNEKFFYYAVKK